jgi:hypothetical protein
VLIVVFPPPMVMRVLALRPNVFAAWPSTDRALADTPSEVPILSAFACRIALAFAITSMSPSHSILTILLLESRTISACMGRVRVPLRSEQLNRGSTRALHCT